MKEFSEFSKEDQKLIAEAMGAHNKIMLDVMNGKCEIADNEQFEFCSKNMSSEARDFLIKQLENTLPAKYNL